MKNLILTSLITAGLMGCASTASKGPDGIMKFADDPRLGEEVDKICFNRAIDGFSDTTNDTVVLEKGVNDHYIVEVSGICQDLKFAQTVAIDSTLSCVRRADYLLVSSSAFSLDDGTGIGPDRCYIDKIHKWDEDAQKDMESEDMDDDS